MAATTPRRSSRTPHQHTPKMSERKKGLFQSIGEASRESLTKHRQLTVLDSESESDDCDLGIMGTLDSSSCDENDPSVPKTPERTVWHTTRSQSKKLLIETQDLKNFIKSPFTLKKYQTRYSCPEKCTGSLSTPATPHLQNHPGTPSSTHSCASVHTTSSTSSKARKSLASLIADTESCSSSLKDLNFDTDSGTDSKENTPTKSIRRSCRRQKMTPKFQSFKGVLVDQKKNISPLQNPTVCLTKVDMSNVISPTQMLKTPHNTSENNISPPKLGPNRRSIIQIDESPETLSGSEKSCKRLHYDSMSETGPIPKHPRLDSNTASKARLSLFNGDRLKEILSTKSFYGKSSPDLNINVTTKISHAIEQTQSHRRRLFPSSSSHRRKRRPGQINLGVRHRIRKPKMHKNRVIIQESSNVNTTLNSKASSGLKDASILSQESSGHDASQELLSEKVDLFDKEKQTIEALLSQWTEEEVPESELSYKCQRELPCFNSSIMEETSQIFQPVTVVPVPIQNIPSNTDAVILELGTQKAISAGDGKELTENVATISVNVTDVVLSSANGAQNCTDVVRNSRVVATDDAGVTINSIGAIQDVVMAEGTHVERHGAVPESGQFLPVEGGYILVADNAEQVKEDLPDLDEIERELKMLDEQILRMAHSNNIDPEAVLASTENHASPTDVQSNSEVAEQSEGTEQAQKVFPIFSKPNPGMPTTPTSKAPADKNKKLIKSGHDQYVIDAGQKKFGATQCNECGVIYQIGDAQDEHDHLVHHNASDVLKFNGLKEECIVGRSHTCRCIRIRGGEPGWKKVEMLLERVVHPQLGYEGRLPSDMLQLYTAYLYVDKRQIIGCVIVELKTKAYKLIPGDPDCCSVESYPVKCGVSRMWTHKNYRRRGLASRMLDCVRASFLYGSALMPQDVAFSAPTAAGKALAAKYCATSIVTLTEYSEIQVPNCDWCPEVAIGDCVRLPLPDTVTKDSCHGVLCQ